MKATQRPPIVVGRESRVEICGDGTSVVLWVGTVSLRLDVPAARDVAATLAHALIRCAEASPVRQRSEPDERPVERDEWDVPTLPEPFAPKAN